ncbi:MAG TPA: ABC transporter permease subunit [Candidatus Limnocylindrales bacterium]|jgi:ABC-type transport system involved in multi-copper enzyme maturation permease subunit|nr:ABC transporter permease subunit [Candidatus Limnocylindrales bacterium]
MTATATNLGAPRRAALREFLSAVQTIMVKELRSRMRGRRAFIVLTVYLGILALITYGVYVVVAPNARNMAGGGFGFGFGQANASALIGQSIFSLLSIFQLILVCFIAPAFTAGQISLEREKQTLDLLVSTPLRPSAIVIGKLAAALAFVVLMIVAAVPITAIVLMYGGASVDDIVRQQLVLLSTALVLGAIGLFFSALLKRTQAATVLTYITVLALTLGTVMLFIFWTVVANQTDDGRFQAGPPKRAPEQILYVNPGIAMLDVVGNTEPGGFGGINDMLRDLRGENVAGFGGGVECVGNVCRDVDQFGNALEPDGRAGLSGYWWPRIGITYVLIATILTLASMRLVVPSGMRWAFGRRRRHAPDAASGIPPDAAIEELQGEPER